MKTVKQALIDEIHYPLRESFVENKLIFRGIDPDTEYSFETANSKEFKGCVADCLYSLVVAPNFNEGDASFSLSDKNAILKMANSIYRSIGEDERGEDQPMVYIGE